MRYKVLQVEKEPDGYVFVALQHHPLLSFMAIFFGWDPLDRVDYFYWRQDKWFFHQDQRPVFDAGLVAYLDQVKRDKC